ncbi:MAG: hypothetical protein F6K00_23455 [Leptolyngbya sp. SIOISBB]|nr:hypothetical protein [Leptolyngbya sp. SIOISBB]
MVNGSSTIYPITVASSEQYAAPSPEATTIDVSFSGTGDGFEKLALLILGMK